MKSFNLTEWALKHKQLVYFFMALFFLAGAFSFTNLGRMEDPDFAIKQMVVIVAWPGATARQMEEQITDKIEKKLQDLPGIDYLKSYSTPGRTIVYVCLKDQIPQKEIRGRWLEVRNMVNELKGSFPQGTLEPMFNDRFDEVYGIMYALTGDGYTYEEMREKAEKIRRILLGVPNVRKVQLIGVQTEKIYIEVENIKLAQLGIDPAMLAYTLQAQNAMMPAGMVETLSDNVYLRITGMFDNLEDIRNTPIQANGRTLRLGDIAKVTRSYSEPVDPKFFYNGQPAVGISLAMEPGGNVLTLGKDLETVIEKIKKELPAGLEIAQTVNQPKVVETSVNEFFEALAEAIIIVMIVSFASLGMRSGLVVALSIPLVIVAVFTVMSLMGINLHRVSLGALILALGLLVDDAIVTIETMSVKIEQGWDRMNAACFAYTSTAYPRLTGELITCIGFIVPIGFSKGIASEYCAALYFVVTLSLLISWLVAGTVTPLLGYHLIKSKHLAESESGSDVYDTKLYRWFKERLLWCLNHRKTVLATTVVCFIGSILLLTAVEQEFFPMGTRPEIIVQLKLHEGASLKNTEEVARQFAQQLDNNPQIAYYTYHTGEGAPRFVLPFEPSIPKTNFAEFVIVAKDTDARDELRASLQELLNKDFSNVLQHTKVIQIGLPADYQVMLRVKGYDHEKVREIAEKVRDVMAANPDVKNVCFNWNEKSKVMHLEIDQDKARKLGISSQALAASLQTQLSGTSIAELRESDRTIGMVIRFAAQDRNDLSHIKDVNIHVGNGRYVPLDQIVKVSFDAEEGLIYRRDLKPAIIVQAEVRPGVTGDDVAKQVYDNLADLRGNLPLGYAIEYDGSKADSIKYTKLLLEPVPAMIIAIMVLIMIQLQSFPKMLLTILTAPLGIIGVALGLFITGGPLGFVGEVGMLALAGIIMRNSIILMDQIDQLLVNGSSKWDAIIDATVIRCRPILLTAIAAILGMIPLMPSVFWRPMAVAIASGLFGATVLTLIVLPVMYAALYRVSPSKTTEINNPVSEIISKEK